MSPPPLVLRWTATVALGACGGWAFDRLNLPLAWMLGAIAATTAAALLRAPVKAPQKLAPVMFSVVGVLLGSGFPADILDRAGRWSLSLAALAPYVVLITVAVAAYFRRVTTFDHPTRFFSACPGGLNEMMLMGSAKGGDEAAIALVHGMRILTVVYILPFAFQYLGGADTAAVRAASRTAALPSLPGWAIMAACAGLGVCLGKWLRLPAGVLIGPMLLSAAAHLSGLPNARPPDALVHAAQVMIGSGIGCRFVGIAPRVFGRAVLVSLGSTALMLAIGGAFALVLGPASGAGIAALILAYSPGGITEMSLVALALDIDPLFVSTHHLGRIILVLSLSPLLFRLLPRPRAAE
ncbi:putative Ammonia monooxygenase [uncultured Alphaproteobacteria bacterium]|uniref:Putative Ammonia monooxygenase n=1 Tax=uncultured Alphaproteobacteria bacterium TaxID=91750 RepID=A0A212JQI6_9PROT|nr:putative Ammonia monooxygenase [uncultured Alphaproteobacteria bacterium]